MKNMRRSSLLELFYNIFLQAPFANEFSNIIINDSVIIHFLDEWIYSGSITVIIKFY